MAAIDDLLHYIFDGNPSTFYPEFAGWVRESRRFKEFADLYRSKIRAKLKNVRDDAGMQDLRVELETAAILVREKRFTLEYEKYAALKQRGPDYTVTFKTHTPFNVEVRRIRNVEVDDANAEGRKGKLMAVVWEKARQMPPSIVNLLWLSAERDISEADLSEAVLTLRQLAERKDEDFFIGRGFKSANDFLKHYRQLSGIVLRQTDMNVIWLNAIARHKTPPDIVRAMQGLATK